MNNEVWSRRGKKKGPKRKKKTGYEGIKKRERQRGRETGLEERDKIKMEKRGGSKCRI